MTLLTKTGLTVAVVTMAMLAVVACSKPKEEPLSQSTTTSAAMRATASCATIAQAGSCSEYESRGGSAPSFGVERAMCGSTHGDFALVPCPKEGRVGVCELSDSEVKRYYAGGERAFTADTARADCEQNGLKGRFLAAR